MNHETRHYLNRINRDFYATIAVEFAATRGSAWAGWIRLLQHINLPIESLLDIGCGNGRFADYLAKQQRQSFAYYGIDNNRQLLLLAREKLSRHPQLITRLIERDLVLEGLPESQVQLTVMFGILHHVPGFKERKTLISQAADCLMPGGYLVFAAWRFYEQERFRQRIVPWPADIEVEKNDFLLDWRRGQPALRYCHYIDDGEHAALIAASGLSLIADFRADGATGELNRYAVLRRM